MNAGGVVCVVWIGLCCSAVYAQHLPKPAARASDGDLRPPVTSPLAPNALAIASHASVPRRTADTAHFLLLAGLPATNSFEGGIPGPSPEIACTQLAGLKVTPKLDSNAFDRLNFSGAAIRATFAHENLVKMGRNFVPGQPLPDAPPYVPLSARQKFDRFLHYSHSGSMVFDVFSDSIYSQATGAYPRFGGGMEGYGKRLGASLAGAEAGAFFGTFLFPALLHQDPRYFPSHQEAISDRMAYAASRVIIGRSDDGRNVFNTSLILSQFVQAAVSNAYIPYRNETVSGTLENALTNLSGVAEWNILTEFWPDIKQFFGQQQHKLLHRPPQNRNADGFNQIAEK